MRVQCETTRPELFSRLVEIGRDACDTSTAEPETVYDRHGVLVVRVGDVVVKAHQANREYGPAFLERIRLADALPDVLVSPMAAPLTVEGRTVTVYPFGEPVDPQQELPWEDAARLLATLHSTPLPADAPSWGRPARVARLVTELGNGPAETEVRRAFATLPAWIRGEATEPAGTASCLVHGDWHLGQMIRTGDGHWRLIDIEDLGQGDPAWDLARPAALYSSGVLHPSEWERFLGAYRDAGGPGVPVTGDPWAVLDIPARTLAIQIAAVCVKAAGKEERPLDAPERAMVDACGRITAAGDAA